ncbi:MAG: FeoA family protein [Christensenellales bacterium]|jgi:ferrous iron transport protein A
MPIVFLRPGETKPIQRLSGPPALRQRLQDLGFVPGRDVTLVGNMSGSLILQVMDSRVALGQGLARHIHI